MAKSSASHTDFGAKDVEVIELESPFQGYFRVDRITLRHQHGNGLWSNPMTREIFERGHAVAILPYDPKTDEFILIEQFRPGALQAGFNPWLIEVPAGIIEEGERPEQVVAREIEEETGCKAMNIEFIMDYLVTPGGSSETMHLFCVEVDAETAVEFAGLESEGEYIKVLRIPSEQAVDWLKSGNIHNSMTIIAIQWFMMNKDEIRKKWV